VSVEESDETIPVLESMFFPGNANVTSNEEDGRDFDRERRQNARDFATTRRRKRRFFSLRRF